MASTSEGSYVGGVPLEYEAKRRAEGATEEDIAFERNQQAARDNASNSRNKGHRAESHVGGVSLDYENKLRAEGATEEEIAAARRDQAARDFVSDTRTPGYGGSDQPGAASAQFVPYGYGDPEAAAAAGKYGGEAVPWYVDPSMTDFAMQNPETYALTREAYAARGWNPGVDQRNFMVGREEGGAQHLRDYAKTAGDLSMAFGQKTADNAITLGADRSSALSALGTSGQNFATDKGNALLAGADKSYELGQTYGAGMQDLGRSAISQGVTGGASVSASADPYAAALRDVYATEGPSGANAAFGLSADQAILNAAKTGNRAAAASSMSNAGMDSALMRAGEYGDWRNNQRNNVSRAGALEFGALSSGSALSNKGYDIGSGLSRSGADMNLRGSSESLDAVNSGYGALMGGQQFGANSALGANKALQDSYGSAADAYFGGVEGLYGAADMTQAVDEIDLRGSMGAWEQTNMRDASLEAYKQRQREIEDQKEMAQWGLVGDGVQTVAALA
jgi:hypothetical protein